MQEITRATDNLIMDISGATSIARVALKMTAADIANDLSAAVTKQILAQEKRQGQAIVEMMKQSEELLKQGHVDIYA